MIARSTRKYADDAIQVKEFQLQSEVTGKATRRKM